ncbi:TolC family protein [Dinghuibacter silviterrae]|uniref:Outer membrane protein TolC n=1 Tax=Dinghuibacter silviterrae TaxID=1539049 RepID=A0A4R8DTW6_9BACT|nr:TolC family protein [Dinghuibacter silviterrae]TDX00885.1 outer membrane protein TolC [Dinghuibacter silviterrae]
MRTIFIFLAGILITAPAAKAQQKDSTLTLDEAIRIGVAHYALLTSKQHAADAAAADLQAAKKDGLPDVTLAAETAYGTLNGMNGLTSGENGLTTLTSGPATATQNWNAAFGSLFVTNVDWNLYSFGMQRAHVAAAAGQYEEDRLDFQQEVFQEKVRVAGAYLTLLAAQRVRRAMEDNLARAAGLRDVIVRRTAGGLNPGVDSSIADAEVSRARLSLIDAQNVEQAEASQLSTVLGIPTKSFRLDSTYATALPGELPGDSLDAHPLLLFLQSRVHTSDLVATYLQKTGLPRLNLFGVGQDRGSGFGADYATQPADYSTSLWQGIDPYRANYLVGIGLSWDITGLGRSRSRARAQRFRSMALSDDYDLERSRLSNQATLADKQLANALDKYREVPTQLKAAQDAYFQKEALYENGLTNIVDVTQTLYLLNRADIDREVSCNAVWQAILYKASATGDMTIFSSQKMNP